jgi:hypothetical protein
VGGRRWEPIPNPHQARTLLTSYFDTVLWIGRHCFDAQLEFRSVPGSGKNIYGSDHIGNRIRNTTAYVLVGERDLEVDWQVPYLDPEKIY